MSNTDLYIAVAGGAQGLAAVQPGQPISLISASGQAITGVVSQIGSAAFRAGAATALNPAAGLITFIKIGTDTSTNGSIEFGDAVSVVGNSVAFTGAIISVVPGGAVVGIPMMAVGRALSLAGIGLSLLDVKIPLGGPPFQVPSSVSDGWRSAQTWRPPIDPLAIDLDADGIETTGIPADGAAPVLFDHDADGTRTATGWLRPDDAWLVLDRNGNGTIDSGRELFGIDTEIRMTGVDAFGGPTTEIRKARSGFDALRSLDSNGDAAFDAADEAFTQVRLWQDLNSDGISQADELSTLADKGIARISLSEAIATFDLGYGNKVCATAPVTRSDGSLTMAGDLQLADRPFPPPSTAADAKLEGQVQGLVSAMAAFDAPPSLAGMGGTAWPAIQMPPLTASALA